MQEAMIPVAMLEERRRLGRDRFDEVWEGVLHLVPSPSPAHQRIQRDLLLVLAPIAKRLGLEAFTDLDLHDPAAPARTSYRQPDLSFVRRMDVSQRGIEGRAELAIEILSPDDESRDKLPFYARVGVREVWLVDPVRPAIEVYVGTQPSRAAALGLALEVTGTDLVIRDGDQTYTVDLRDRV